MQLWLRGLRRKIRFLEVTRTAVREPIGSILVYGNAYDYDRELADGIVPRLSGSANYDRAVAGSMEQCRFWGSAMFMQTRLRFLLPGISIQLGTTRLYRQTMCTE